MKPRAETDHRIDPRRSGQRSLGAAEGVLVALRGCRLDDAFSDIVQTAKRHNVAPMELADALVAIAENDVTRELDDRVVAAVDQAWGTLLGQPGSDAGRRRAQQVPPTNTAGTCSEPPNLLDVNVARSDPECPTISRHRTVSGKGAAGDRKG